MSIQSLLTLDLPETAVNTAVDGIIARARELVDRNGVALFADFDRAGDILVAPPLDWPISGRIWHDSLSGISRSQQMFIGEWEIVCSIYLYFHLEADDIHQHGFQAQRERFCRYLMVQLEYPEEGNPDAGLVPTRNWEFDAPATFDIDHTAPYKRFGEYVTVFAPLFVSRIDFKLRIWDTEREANG